MYMYIVQEFLDLELEFFRNRLVAFKFLFRITPTLFTFQGN